MGSHLGLSFSLSRASTADCRQTSIQVGSQTSKKMERDDVQQVNAKSLPLSYQQLSARRFVWVCSATLRQEPPLLQLLKRECRDDTVVLLWETASGAWARRSDVLSLHISTASWDMKREFLVSDGG